MTRVFWLKGHRGMNIHSSRNCHLLSVTLGPLCLRIDWPLGRTDSAPTTKGQP